MVDVPEAPKPALAQEPVKGDQTLPSFLPGPGTFAVPVRQFLRPNGIIRPCSVRLPVDLEPAYLEMTRHGCHFEAEVLTDETVSVTISDDEQDVDISLTDNGAKVLEGMYDMLKRARWKEPSGAPDTGEDESQSGGVTW